MLENCIIASLAPIIPAENIANQNNIIIAIIIIIVINKCYFSREHIALRSHIITKLALNDVKAAVLVVTSDDNVPDVTLEVLQSLRPKHTPERENSLAPIIPDENIAMSADLNNIMIAIIILIIVIYKCYFSRVHIALSYKKTV